LPREGRKLIVFQVLGILVVSSVLGFAFNASNPIGIRFSKPSASENELSVAAAPVVAPTPTPTTPAPAPPQVSAGQAQANAPSLPPLPPSPVRSLPAEVIPSPVGNPVVAARTPPAPLAVSAPVKAPTPVSLEQLNAPVDGMPHAHTPPAHIHSAPTTWAAIRAEALAGQVVLLDARARSAYDAGHIPGAISFPEASTPADFEGLKAKYGPDTPIVVYCSSATCAISKRVADRLLQQYGFQSVRFMRGGYEEWQRAEVLQTKSGS
jgi:rhodanese-related sulfurtransferase